MNFQCNFKNICIIFFTIWNLSLSIKIPLGDFNLRDFLKELKPKIEKPGVTVIKDRFGKPNFTIFSTPEECNRNCYVRAPPKICLYRFFIEHYTTVGGACDICSRNATNNCQCILVDGIERTMMAVNRQYPGPSIQVCKHDTVVVDVYNGADGAEVTIHWHGILQHNSQFYDGVPFVTQCPIHKGNVFRYKWTAENSGTHFWHSHTGFQKMDGVAGSIIIRESVDIHQSLYDYDDNIMVITDWFHELSNARYPGRLRTMIGQEPANILINGKGQAIDPYTNIPTNTPLEVFEVERGKRYRFRMINACGGTCPVQLTIEGHKMQIIATDGEPVLPVIVDTIVSVSAERYDFVLHADQPVGTYWIQIKARGLCDHTQLQQLAILRYAGGPDVPESPPPSFIDCLPIGKVMNPLDSACSTPRDDGICIDELQSAYPVNPKLLQEKPDVKIFLPFKFLILPKEELFKPFTFTKFLVVMKHFHLVALVDGITYLAPTAPLLTQYEDNDPTQFCNGNSKPENCGLHCLCTHKTKIPLNAVAEVCLVDEVQVPSMYHPFHLHGHTFHVMGVGRLPNKSESINLQKAIALDMDQGLLTRFRRPPGKDTLPVPNNGYACFRFIADNPGFWLFHCHFLFHLTIGMNLIFQVGSINDLPPPPPDFPKCGNFIPEV